jgi:hypothetical protein
MIALVIHVSDCNHMIDFFRFPSDGRTVWNEDKTSRAFAKWLQFVKGVLLSIFAVLDGADTLGLHDANVSINRFMPSWYVNGPLSRKTWTYFPWGRNGAPFASACYPLLTQNRGAPRHARRYYSKVNGNASVIAPPQLKTDQYWRALRAPVHNDHTFSSNIISKFVSNNVNYLYKSCIHQSFRLKTLWHQKVVILFILVAFLSHSLLNAGRLDVHNVPHLFLNSWYSYDIDLLTLLTADHCSLDRRPWWPDHELQALIMSFPMTKCWFLLPLRLCYFNRMLYFVHIQSLTKAGRLPKPSLRTTEFTVSAPVDMALHDEMLLWRCRWVVCSILMMGWLWMAVDACF